MAYYLFPGPFAICRLPAAMPLPDWALRGHLHSVTRTSDELSVVCLAENVPAGIKAEAPWICFKLAGPLPFSEVGVLASFINPLAEYGIPILAIATFDTDYVLIKEEFAGAAMGALRAAGHELIS